MRPCFSVILGLLFSACVQAQDCMVSTAPPDRLTSLPGVSDHQSFPDTGVMNLSFTNGDQILAEYGTCELALNAHYLLFAAEPPNSEKINAFLAAVLPAAADVAAVQSELKTQAPLSPGKPVTLKGSNDAHTLVLTDASSPLFRYELHYRWQAPQH